MRSFSYRGGVQMSTVDLNVTTNEIKRQRRRNASNTGVISSVV